MAGRLKFLSNALSIWFLSSNVVAIAVVLLLCCSYCCYVVAIVVAIVVHIVVMLLLMLLNVFTFLFVGHVIARNGPTTWRVSRTPVTTT